MDLKSQFKTGFTKTTTNKANTGPKKTKNLIAGIIGSLLVGVMGYGAYNYSKNGVDSEIQAELKPFEHKSQEKPFANIPESKPLGFQHQESRPSSPNSNSFFNAVTKGETTRSGHKGADHQSKGKKSHKKQTAKKKAHKSKHKKAKKAYAKKAHKSKKHKQAKHKLSKHKKQKKTHKKQVAKKKHKAHVAHNK